MRISPRSIQEKAKSLSPKLEPAIEGLRNKIFSEELNELVKQVTEKKQVFNELKAKPFELFSNIDFHLLNNLNKVYNSKNKKLSLSEYLSSELSKYNFSSFILFQFYHLEGLYKPEIYFGVSSETGEKFYFHSTGNYLKAMKDNFLIIEFDENLRGDIFFQKKISRSDFEDFSGIVLYKFSKNNLVGLLGCFYKDLQFTEQLRLELKEFFSEILEPIYPTIGVFFHEQKQVGKTPLEDYLIYQQIIRYVKSILIRGDFTHLYIYHLDIQNYFEVEDRLEKKKKLIHALEELIQTHGYVIEKSVHGYYLIVGNNILENLKTLLNSEELQPFQFLITHSEYPKDSPNLFIHF